MNAVDAFKSHIEQARIAADQGRWRQAARNARLAIAAYPEPPGWLARTWRKLRLGEPLRHLDEHLETWQRRALSECQADAAAQKTALVRPDASEPAAQLLALAGEMKACGGSEAGFALEGIVADWRQRSSRYFELMNAGTVAAAALRHREATSDFEQAFDLFATKAAAEGRQANADRIASEAAFENQLREAEQARSRRRLETARALLVRATRGFPRDDGHAALARVERELQALASLVEGVRAARDEAWARAERAFGAAVEAYGADAPGSLSARLFQVSMALRRGHPDRALSLLEELQGPVAASRRAIALVALGRFSEGAEQFESCKLTELARSARAHHARRCWQTLSTLERAVAGNAWEEGEREAMRHLAIEDDEAVRSALEETLKPARARSLWDHASPEARVRLTLADLQRAPSPLSLHQWFVALDAVVDADPSLTPTWLVACAAVQANLASSPAFTSPHRTWSEVDREIVKAHLRQRLEHRLDWERSNASAADANWRTVWQVEAAALALAGPERRMPVREGLNLTPGLWRQLGERSDEVPPSGDGGIESEAFAALYGPSSAAVAAWLARDLEVLRRLTVADATGEPWRGQATFARSLQAVERGLEMLEAEGTWKGLLPHRQLLRRHRPWCERADKLAQAMVDELKDEARRAFVTGWYEALESDEGRTWHVNFKAADLAGALGKDQVSEQAALREIEALLRIDPRNAAAKRLQTLIGDRKIAAELDSLLRRGRVADAVDLAIARGSEDVRARTAAVLWEILDENHRRMERDLIKEFARSLYRLCPDNPNYRELYFGL